MILVVRQRPRWDESSITMSPRRMYLLCMCVSPWSLILRRSSLKIATSRKKLLDVQSMTGSFAHEVVSHVRNVGYIGCFTLG